jgi:putative membrane protein
MHLFKRAALAGVASIALIGTAFAQTPPTTSPPADAPMATAPSTDPNAPLPGANSFTEKSGQRAHGKAGFSQVSQLKKDDQGIWRATARRGDEPTNVALDFRGNVVAK